MKKLLLLVLAAPLAGCAQRAELATSVGQPAQGPFTLRYKLADRHSNEYQLRIEGDTTTGISTQSTSEPATSDTTQAPERTVQAKFQTQMTVRQDATAAPDDLTGSTTSTPDTTGTPSSPPSDTTTPSASEGTGSTSMNEDRAPGTARTRDANMPLDTATEGTPGSTGSTGTAANLFDVRQQVTNWTAQVDLPEGQIPNRFNGSFQNGQMNIQAQGAQIDLPQRYQQQILQTLNRPVIARISSKGEILNVEWPMPEQASTAAPGMKTESSADGLRAMSGSTETLNLWFAVIRLPDQAVNVGQTWDAKDQFPVRAGTSGPQFYMEREAKYTLTNVTQTPDGPVAEIAVNETLKLNRGEMSSETSPPTAGTDAADTTDSTTSTADTGAKPDLLQTRMGKVYFNIDRGVIDRAEQQVSVTWNTAISAAASSTGTTTSNVATQGQLQGTVHLDRVGATAATTGTTGGVLTGATNAPLMNTPDSTSPTTTPSTTEPSGNLAPNGTTRTPGP